MRAEMKDNDIIFQNIYHESESNQTFFHTSLSNSIISFTFYKDWRNISTNIIHIIHTIQMSNASFFIQNENSLMKIINCKLMFISSSSFSVCVFCLFPIAINSLLKVSFSLLYSHTFSY